MEEKQRGEMPEQKNTVSYEWLRSRFPEGLVGAENAVPVQVDENDLETLVFNDYPYRDQVSVNLFLAKHRYARKSLVVDKFGQLSEDEKGVIPEFDMSLKEPVFVSSNQEIFDQAVAALQKKFSDN